MQVAAMNPIAVRPEEVPTDIIEKELEIAREKAREAGKPENLIDRIAQGFFAEILQRIYFVATGICKRSETNDRTIPQSSK